MISRTENALSTMDCFLVAYRNVSWSHTFGHVQFDHQRNGILASLQTVGFRDERLLACTIS